jgi:carbon storage regulator
MLVLSRKVGEKLVVGDDISFVVLGICGNQVRIGIEAPRHVSIHREEVYKKLLDEGFEKIPAFGKV